MNSKINKKSYLHAIILGSVIISAILFAGCKNGGGEYKTLPVPSNLTVSDITADGAKLSWSKVDNAYCYYIMYCPEGYEIWTCTETFKTEYTLNNLYNESEYTVLVQAVANRKSEVEISSDFAKKTFKTLADVVPENELARPKNVKGVFNDKKTALTVSWDAVENAVYYDIYLDYTVKHRDTPPDDDVLFYYTVPATQTSYTIENILEFNKISIKVAARNKDFSDSCRWSKDVYIKN